jgi:hypothetical protein
MRRNIQVIGGRPKPCDHELQQPPKPTASRAADVAQRDALHAHPFTEPALFLSDHSIVWIQGKGSATPLAAVGLFAAMNVAVSLNRIDPYCGRASLGIILCSQSLAIGLVGSFREDRTDLLGRGYLRFL